MWHRVKVVLTDVSEERIASIFRVKGKIRKSAREASVRDVKSRNLRSYISYFSSEKLRNNGSHSVYEPSVAWFTRLRLLMVNNVTPSHSTPATRQESTQDCTLNYITLYSIYLGHAVA
jgi:hypothetical protein